MKFLHWQSSYRLNRIDDLKTVDLASLRMRAGALLAAINRNSCRLTLGERIHERARVCIIGKPALPDMQTTARNWIDQFEKFKSSGGKLILDYTDNYLSIDVNPSKSRIDFYEHCLSISDHCVASSERLAEILADHCKCPITVIPDAIEVPVSPPRSRSNAVHTMLWFGHISNLGYLVEFLPRMAALGPARLLVLTNAKGIEWLRATPLELPENLELQCAEWSVSLMQKAAENCDLCIIPSDPSDIRKSGVSSNRLVTALALGLPTCADVLPSYKKYQNYFVDIRSDDFEKTFENPLGWRDRVIEAQQTFVKDYELMRVGHAWCELAGLASVV